MSSQTALNEANCFKILLATDIHLGYNEKDSIRGNDSYVTFQEILAQAKVNKVDFILLGGDLFHDSVPSPNALQQCTQLLHEYTLGDGEVNFEILSNHEVNYENPNINIAIPVFSIHGNHDDPSGFTGLSSMNLLSANRLLNYFGRCDDLMDVTIDPILMKKGESQLALYGLSHIHDNRLARLFGESKVRVERPNESSGKWFNLMVLHQNRVDRGRKNYLPEEALPDFLNFVLWGHEHDCRIQPEECPGKSFYVSQPGSSVATSLSEGEATEKYIGLLYVCGDKFKLEPIKLNTVRPFVFKSINLENCEEQLLRFEGDVKQKVKGLLAETVEEMIAEAEKQRTIEPSQPKLPLIRLRVQYKNEDHAFNPIRFGQQYTKRVANPAELILLQKVKRVKSENKTSVDGTFQKDIDGAEELPLEDFLNRHFKDRENVKMKVLNPKSMMEITRLLAEKGDDDGAKKIIEYTMQKAMEFLEQKMPETNKLAISAALDEFQEKRDEVFNGALAFVQARGNKTASSVHNAQDDNQNDRDVSATTPRASTASRPNARGNKAQKNVSASASGRGRGARGQAASSVPSARNELNVSTTRKSQAKQPNIQDAFGRTSSRKADKVAYVSDESD